MFELILAIYMSGQVLGGQVYISQGKTPDAYTFRNANGQFVVVETPIVSGWVRVK